MVYLFNVVNVGANQSRARLLEASYESIFGLMMYRYQGGYNAVLSSCGLRVRIT